ASAGPNLSWPGLSAIGSHHPPQTLHACPSLAVHARPFFVSPYHRQLALCRTPDLVLIQCVFWLAAGLGGAELLGVSKLTAGANNRGDSRLASAAVRSGPLISRQSQGATARTSAHSPRLASFASRSAVANSA